jgi:acyl-CoA thioester hydrolase
VAERFERTFHVRWGDMDFNAHMRNTAYLDVAADVRMMFFELHGFPVSEFMRRQIGPAILRDEVQYFRELHLLERIRVTLRAAGLSPDGSRFLLRNEFFRESDGVMAARVTSMGGWIDQARRKLVAPPPELRALFDAIEQTEDFQELESLLRAVPKEAR